LLLLLLVLLLLLLLSLLLALCSPFVARVIYVRLRRSFVGPLFLCFCVLVFRCRHMLPPFVPGRPGSSPIPKGCFVVPRCLPCFTRFPPSPRHQVLRDEHHLWQVLRRLEAGGQGLVARGCHGLELGREEHDAFHARFRRERRGRQPVPGHDGVGPGSVRRAEHQLVRAQPLGGSRAGQCQRSHCGPPPTPDSKGKEWE
jgi:hypothetical protein